jgi:hypothetical protein
LQRQTIEVRDLHTKASQQNPASIDSAVHQFITIAAIAIMGLGLVGR